MTALSTWASSRTAATSSTTWSMVERLGGQIGAPVVMAGHPNATVFHHDHVEALGRRASPKPPVERDGGDAGAAGDEDKGMCRLAAVTHVEQVELIVAARSRLGGDWGIPLATLGRIGRRTARTPGNAASLSCARRRLAFIVITSHCAPSSVLRFGVSQSSACRRDVSVGTWSSEVMTSFRHLPGSPEWADLLAQIAFGAQRPRPQRREPI